MSTKILVIDDDTNICEMLRVYLENEGYEVKTANDGIDGVNFFKVYEPDLVLLDIMMPKKDGWQVCREIREMSGKPVIMITAKGDVFDKVLGLELGADDFIVKPFDMKELSARVKAVLRRYNSHDHLLDEEVIKFENIELSLQKYELKLCGKSVDVPPKELELLYFLASNYNRSSIGGIVIGLLTSSILYLTGEVWAYVIFVVCFGICVNDKTYTYTHIFKNISRTYIRKQAVKFVLKKLLEILKNE